MQSLLRVGLSRTSFVCFFTFRFLEQSLLSLRALQKQALSYIWPAGSLLLSNSFQFSIQRKAIHSLQFVHLCVSPPRYFSAPNLLAFLERVIIPKHLPQSGFH